VETPETRYVTVGDAQVAYQVLGDGPVDLVFTHGHCHLDLHWDLAPEAEFFRRLASFSRLILFDRRGSGCSDRIEGGRFPTWEEWSQDLLAVLDAAGSARPALFAEAEAGPMAILFAATHPARISSLVLGNTAAKFAASPDYPIGLSADSVDALVAFIGEHWGRPEIADTLPGLAHDRAAREALARLLRASATPLTAAKEYGYVYRDLDARSSLALVSVPTLVMANSRTMFVRGGEAGVNLVRATAEAITGARYVEFDGDDAFFFAGDPTAAISEVAEFLTGTRPPEATDRVLATILFTDIVGSTERAAADGDRRWRSTLDEHDAVVRRELARFRGREVNTTGDGFLASFDGPARAVRCGEAITSAVSALGLAVRVGVHSGECEVRGDDLSGLAVHIAARVGALAQAREVWVSSTVRELVAGSGLTFEARGQFELRGVPEPWSLYRLVTAGAPRS
jgi:class 3 adenylate cyclase/pimeloyl-ACP methyl ester carboxylesterase